MALEHWPVAREAGTYKDMVRELGNTNFTDVEDEAKYWLQHYDGMTVQCAIEDAGYGASYAARVIFDVTC